MTQAIPRNNLENYLPSHFYALFCNFKVLWPASMHKEDLLHNSSFHMLPAGNIHELPELKSSFHSVGLAEKLQMNEYVK